MSVSSLGLFFIVVFITCITPGAGVLYTPKNAINYGKANAFLSPTGNAIGVLFMSTLAASGLGAVIHESPVMFYGLQICGCMLLFWFGWKSWTAPAISLSSSIKSFNLKELKQERIHILTSAALLQVTNPMCIVFLLSLFPQFIDPKGSYVQQVSLMIAMFVITCWFVHIAYSYSAAAAADRWMTKNFSLWLNKISGFLFWLISVSILVKMF